MWKLKMLFSTITCNMRKFINHYHHHYLSFILHNVMVKINFSLIFLNCSNLLWLLGSVIIIWNTAKIKSRFNTRLTYVDFWQNSTKIFFFRTQPIWIWLNPLLAGRLKASGLGHHSKSNRFWCWKMFKPVWATFVLIQSMQYS